MVNVYFLAGKGVTIFTSCTSTYSSPKSDPWVSILVLMRQPNTPYIHIAFHLGLLYELMKIDSKLTFEY